MLKFLWSILKMIFVILIVFLIPFMIPIMFKIFEYLNIFNSIEELGDIMEVLNNKYTFMYVVFGVILLIVFFHKGDNIKEILKNKLNEINAWKGSVNYKDKLSVSLEGSKEAIRDSVDKKEFIKAINNEKKNENADSQNSIKEIKNLLGIGKEPADFSKCSECNKAEMQEENEKLRNFATYNMLNTDARSILHVIYNEKYMEKSTFKSRIIQGYKKRNKRNIKIANKDINKIAQNKYDTIYEGLKFLNIIEPSEDDTTIKLTKEGKKFVEKYIEKKEVV